MQPTTVALTLVHNDWERTGSATFTFCLEPQLIYFQGHFPQHQILPAVAQLKLLMDCVHALDPSLQCCGAPAIKFTNLLRPGDQVKLELHLKRESLKLSFTYYKINPDSECVTSSGTLTLVKEQL